MSMIYTGISGLNAAQTALNVTSKNIANAGVNGYSRQVSNFQTSEVGGVYVANIERVSDQYAVQQLWHHATQYGYSTTYASHTSQLETLIAGDNTSLSPAMNGFFGTLNAASADPMDIAYRQEVLSSANDMAARFNSLSNSLQKQTSDVQSQMQALSSEANGLLSDMARINESIVAASSVGDVPSQLLDERDQVVQQLSELLDVDILIEGDQSATITLPSGEPLVSRSEHNELTLIPGYPNNSRTQLAVDTGNAVKRIDTPGGALGGLIDFRDEVLAPQQKELDRLALVMASEMNDQLTQGYDLNGNPGSPLFSNINSSALMSNRSSSISGSNSVNLNVEISNTSGLTADDYTITMGDDGKLLVQRQPGGESVEYKEAEDGSISFEGITISPDDGQSFADMQPGDTYLIEPGKGASGSMQVILDDPEKLAFSDDPEEPGSNANLQKLIDLQDKQTIGGLTMNQAWNAIVSDVASASASATTSFNANAMLYQEASNQVTSNSGVSLDEEAANMLMFQQLYSANAKVIASADQMFNTLLSII